MNRWLFKSDPDVYSWIDLQKVKKEMWDGVANNLALKNLRTIQKGDLIFIYHSGADKSIIGIAKALSASYPNPSEKDPKLAVIDIAPLESLVRPVTLAEVKKNKKLQSWELVRFSRLSVMPVTSEQWEEILSMSRKEK